VQWWIVSRDVLPRRRPARAAASSARRRSAILTRWSVWSSSVAAGLASRPRQSSWVASLGCRWSSWTSTSEGARPRAAHRAGVDPTAAEAGGGISLDHGGRPGALRRSCGPARASRQRPDPRLRPDAVRLAGSPTIERKGRLLAVATHLAPPRPTNGASRGRRARSPGHRARRSHATSTAGFPAHRENHRSAGRRG